MNYLTDADEFSRSQLAIDALIRREQHLPGQVFKEPLSHFVFIQWDDVYNTGDFFEKIKSFLASTGESRWFLAVLDPDPEVYFFRHFGKYPFVEISTGDTFESYRQLLQSDPGDSPADAVAHNSTVAVLYSDSGQWAIYGDRDYELWVAAFADRGLHELFTSSFEPDWLFTVGEVIENILPPVYGGKGVPPELREQLLRHYPES
jgi:hypothetical protein